MSVAGPPFDPYPADPDRVREAATATRNRVGEVRDIATDVEREHRPAVDAVEGELVDSVHNAPTQAIRTASDVHQRAEFAAGCLEWFAQAIEEFNTGRTTYPRSVSELNADWETAVRIDDLERRDPDLDIEDGQLDETASDLRTEYAATEVRLDEDAAEAAAMLQRGPNTDDLRTLWRAGVLPPYAVLLYPNAGLQDIALPPEAQRELLDYLIDHPDLLVDLPPALATVVDGLPSDLRTDVYVEQRMEQLRREGLLSGDNPGGLYEEWIRNTVENDVPLATVIDIARDHDIRPDSFEVLDGLREITDPDGKSFFVLDPGLSSGDARQAVLMTYILNAGTGYEDGEYDPTPYSSAEFQRIVDRSHDNSWFSYSMDVDFVHSHGGTLVTTPNGMLMGGGGDWLQEQYSLNGGTTWGDIFMVNDVEADELDDIIESGEAPNEAGLDLDRLLHHEEIHSQQWARYGYADFGARYIDASTNWTWRGWGPFQMWLPEERDACDNEYEREAGLEDGGYGCAPEPDEPEGENDPSDGRNEDGDLGYEWHVDNEGMPRCEPFGHALERETYLHLNPADEQEHQIV